MKKIFTWRRIVTLIVWIFLGQLFRTIITKILDHYYKSTIVNEMIQFIYSNISIIISTITIVGIIVFVIYWKIQDKLLELKSKIILLSEIMKEHSRNNATNINRNFATHDQYFEATKDGINAISKEIVEKYLRGDKTNVHPKIEASFTQDKRIAILQNDLDGNYNERITKLFNDFNAWNEIK
jgi:hypothetical protein